jgi:hypothetical protein
MQNAQRLQARYSLYYLRFYHPSMAVRIRTLSENPERVRLAQRARGWDLESDPMQIYESAATPRSSTKACCDGIERRSLPAFDLHLDELQ